MTRAGVDSWFLGVAGLCSAIFVLLAGRDLFTSLELNGSIRLMHLFTYNYTRPWPPTLDFTSTFKAIALVAAAFSLALAFPRVRRHAAVLLTALGLIARGVRRERLPGASIAALGAAGNHPRVLPASQRARGAAHRVSDELEGRELLHGQPPARVRSLGDRLQELPEGAARERRARHLREHGALEDELFEERARQREEVRTFDDDAR